MCPVIPSLHVLIHTIAWHGADWATDFGWLIY